MTNADRRVRALWNVLDEAGRNTLIVGYHNTFPAEHLRGAMVSNWLVQAHMADAIRADPRPEGFALSLAHPPEIRRELVELELRVRDSWEREILGFVDFGPDPSEEFRGWVEDSATLGEEDRRWPYFVRRAWTFDRFHAEAALLLMPRFDPELTMVHFQSADWILHQFMYFHQPELFSVEERNWDEATRARLELARPRYAHTVARFFEHLDTQLGRLLEAAGPGTSVMVLSDHGFDPHDDPWSSGHHDEAPPGFWVAAGPGVRRHVRLERASLYDIAPTLAASLGHELSRRFDGVVWDDLLCEPADPAATVDDYEDGPRYQPSIAAPAGLTEELEQQLQSLGYVR
jgi:hypothetical protein